MKGSSHVFYVTNTGCYILHQHKNLPLSKQLLPSCVKGKSLTACHLGYTITAFRGAQSGANPNKILNLSQFTNYFYPDNIRLFPRLL